LLPDFRVRQRDYLLEILRAITQELDLDKVLARILNISIEMLAGQAGLIALREGQMGWKVVVSQGIPSSFLQRIGLLLKDVQLHQEPERYELKEVNRLIQGLTRAASLGLFTGVGLPLNARNQLIGVLFVFRNYRGQFSSNDRNLLQSFADQAAIAVHNAQLYTKVLHEERRMVALLDSAADGIMILAPDHTIVRCNPAMSRMLGIPVNEIQLHSHEKVIKWNSRKEGLTLEEAEVGGWPLSQTATLYIEGDIIRPNRAPLPVGITYAPLLTSASNTQS